MYHYQCDWCGKRINEVSEQYVRANIRIVTTEVERFSGKRIDEVEPTRFFHVTPLRTRSEWDRLGLDIEVGSDKLGDCCYTRALRAIEGGDFDEPDAGLEWRLVPVGARILDTPSRPRVPGGAPGCPDGVWADPGLAEFLGTLAPSPRHKMARALAEGGIETLGLVEELDDEELLALDGMGAITLAKLRSFIAARQAGLDRKVRA
jgi:hypothetical protein